MNRETIARRIRALRQKTVENGCTEAEALVAAQMLADLLTKYNMTVDEAEMRATPFERHYERHDDWVGDRLWKVATAVAELTGARYWSQAPGEIPTVNFFGFQHEVDIARYMVEVCAAAMRREQDRRRNPRRSLRRQRNVLLPFLDGMADRLATRILAMKAPKPTGTGLIVLRGALVDQAMADAGINLKEGRARGSRNADTSYRDGLAAGDRVSLSVALAGRQVGEVYSISMEG